MYIGIPTLAKPLKGTGGDLPCNCLQAILLLITPSNAQQHSNSLIQRDPDLACICYELIYQLCAAPLTSALTLSYLRIRAVQFLHVQIQELLYLACLPDSLLLNKDSVDSRYLFSYLIEFERTFMFLYIIIILT
jgi:hypothetical protein